MLHSDEATYAGAVRARSGAILVARSFVVNELQLHIRRQGEWIDFIWKITHVFCSFDHRLYLQIIASLFVAIVIVVFCAHRREANTY